MCPLAFKSWWEHCTQSASNVSLLCCVLDSFRGHLHEPPSDIDLEEVTKEVMGKLRDDWVKLQSYLAIPDDVMYELEHEGSERNKIRALLKRWRNMYDGSRAQLAECLQNADQRLHGDVKLWCMRPWMAHVMVISIHLISSLLLISASFRFFVNH